MSLTYATDLFDESTVASFAERVRDESSPQLVQRIRTVRGWQISTYLLLLTAQQTYSSPVPLSPSDGVCNQILGGDLFDVIRLSS